MGRIYQTRWTLTEAEHEQLVHAGEQLVKAIRNHDMPDMQRSLHDERLLYCEYTIPPYFVALDLLGRAALEGTIDMVRLILEKGISAEGIKIYRQHESPLQVATSGQREDVCDLLVQSGADPFRAAGVGDAPIRIAAELKHERIFARFMQVGTAQRALDAAAACGYVEGCEKAIEAGAKVTVEFDKSTALAQAVRGSHLEAVRFLLRKEADPNAGKADRSPKFFLFRNGSWPKSGSSEIAVALLERGLHVDAQDLQKLLFICMICDSVELAEGLLARHVSEVDMRRAARDLRRAKRVAAFLRSLKAKRRVLSRAARAEVTNRVLLTRW